MDLYPLSTLSATYIAAPQAHSGVSALDLKVSPSRDLSKHFYFECYFLRVCTGLTSSISARLERCVCVFFFAERFSASEQWRHQVENPSVHRLKSRSR